MIGIIVSGRAVPTAARTEPTAPSASSSLWPNHSMPFVNSSAPMRITRKARRGWRCPMVDQAPAEPTTTADGDDHEDRRRDEGHRPLALVA